MTELSNKLLIVFFVLLIPLFLQGSENVPKKLYLTITNQKDIKEKNLIQESNINYKNRIQSLLNVSENNRTLYIKKGNYTIIGDLLVPDNTQLIFEKGAKFYFMKSKQGLILGNNCTIINAHIIGTYNLISQKNTTQGITIKNKKNISLSGGTVEGFSFSNVAINNSHNIKVNGIVSKNAGSKDDGDGGWYGQGIYITKKSSHITIMNSNIHDNGKHGIQAWSDGSSLAAKNVLIRNNYSSNNGDIGIVLANTTNFKIINNKANNNGLNGGPFGGQGIQIVGFHNKNTSQQGIIQKNTTSYNTENGIELNKFVKNISIIDNNSFNNNWSGMKISNNCNKISVKDNTNNHNHLHGIDVRKSYSIYLTGNLTMYNGEHGVFLNESLKCSISHFTSNSNGTLSPNRSGIEVDKSKKISIINGTASDLNSHKTQEYGIRLHNSKDIKINKIRGNGNKKTLIGSSN
ncbi:hypothetical protein ASE46_02540 [Bacillus sp. Root239]|nr:hypothetical protein ASE46_02540 [Bacillus sp. Root239]